MTIVFLIAWMSGSAERAHSTPLIIPVHESYSGMETCQALAKHIEPDATKLECFNPYTGESMKIK